MDKMTEQMAINTITDVIEEKRKYFYESSDIYKTLSESMEIVLQSLKELEQYRAIGTVEELQALKEKSVAKKPIMIGHRRDGEPVYDCGCCGSTLKVADQPYCMICGCKVDWE